MKQSLKTLMFLAGTAVLLSACKPGVPENAKPALVIEQGEVCDMKGWAYDYVPAAACKPGQKVAYLPASWGNEQLPLLFAAVNCDMRYAIALTNGGVVCIYAPTNQALKARSAAK